MQVQVSWRKSWLTLLPNLALKAPGLAGAEKRQSERSGPRRWGKARGGRFSGTAVRGTHVQQQATTRSTKQGLASGEEGKGRCSGGTRADAFTRDLPSGGDAATAVRTRKMNKNDPR